MRRPPEHLVLGPDRHGVVRHALGLLTNPALAGARVRRFDTVEALDADACVWTSPGPLHVHLTDHLLGASPAEAADRLERLAAARPISLGLHDIPDADDPATVGGPGRRDRLAAYRRFAHCARRVVVASRHEAGLLTRLGADPSTVVLVPLPLRPPPASAERPPPLPRLALLGFLHPGKGMETLIEASRALRPGVELVNLGPVAHGHDAYAAELVAAARRAGRKLSITGWLSAAELHARARQVAVPVLAHRHMSASGSLGSWWQAGRRPIGLPTAYLRELGEQNPHAVALRGDLAAAIAAALAEPQSTWLPPGIALWPGPAEAARLLAELLSEISDEPSAGVPDREHRT